MNAVDDDLVAWLLEGDASIRWRVHRDLIGSSASTVGAERVGRDRGLGRQAAFVAESRRALGWRRLHAQMDLNDVHAACFLCSAAPREAGAVVALREQKSAFAHRSSDHQRAPTDARKHLVWLGLLPGNRAALAGCERLWEWQSRWQVPETCIVSILVRLTVAHGYHAERRQEFFLRHRLYKSHRSGQVAIRGSTRFPQLPQWHFDVLRGLEYFVDASADHGQRLADAVAVVRHARRINGRWPTYAGYPGRTWFRMEQPGLSRWNTMRALRVLNWWDVAA